MFQDLAKKPKIDKYHRILNAAIKVFAEEGFFLLNHIPDRQGRGVADGTIYLYSKNKEDILLQFFDYKSHRVLDRFRKEVDEADDAGNKLKNLIQSHLQEFQKDPNMAAVFQAEARKGRHLKNHVNNLTKTYLGIVGEIIEQGQAEGMFRKDLYFSLVKRLGAPVKLISGMSRNIKITTKEDLQLAAAILRKSDMD